MSKKTKEKRKNRKKDTTNKKQKTKKTKSKNKKKHENWTKGIKCLNQEHVQQYCQWRPVPF